MPTVRKKRVEILKDIELKNETEELMISDTCCCLEGWTPEENPENHLMEGQITLPDPSPAVNSSFSTGKGSQFGLFGCLW